MELLGELEDIGWSLDEILPPSEILTPPLPTFEFTEIPPPPRPLKRLKPAPAPPEATALTHLIVLHHANTLDANCMYHLLCKSPIGAACAERENFRDAIELDSLYNFQPISYYLAIAPSLRREDVSRASWHRIESSPNTKRYLILFLALQGLSWGFVVNEAFRAFQVLEKNLDDPDLVALTRLAFASRRRAPKVAKTREIFDRICLALSER